MCATIQLSSSGLGDLCEEKSILTVCSADFSWFQQTFISTSKVSSPKPSLHLGVRLKTAPISSWFSSFPNGSLEVPENQWINQIGITSAPLNLSGGRSSHLITGPKQSGGWSSRHVIDSVKVYSRRTDQRNPSLNTTTNYPLVLFIQSVSFLLVLAAT